MSHRWTVRNKCDDEATGGSCSVFFHLVECIDEILIYNGQKRSKILSRLMLVEYQHNKFTALPLRDVQRPFYSRYTSTTQSKFKKTLTTFLGVQKYNQSSLIESAHNNACNQTIFPLAGIPEISSQFPYVHSINISIATVIIVNVEEILGLPPQSSTQWEQYLGLYTHNIQFIYYFKHSPCSVLNGLVQCTN